MLPVDTVERMAWVIREDPSITVKELTKKMGFAEQKSVYYWLDKANFKGLKAFRRAVLAHRASRTILPGEPTAGAAPFGADREPARRVEPRGDASPGDLEGRGPAREEAAPAEGACTAGAALGGHANRKVVALPVAVQVSQHGDPIWSQDTLFLELPQSVSPAVFAVRTQDLQVEAEADEWLVIDPVEEPEDGSLALCILNDGRRAVCRVFRMGTVRRYLSLAGGEVLGPAVAGVVKARLQYLS
jgi:hypothetical protein